MILIQLVMQGETPVSIFTKVTPVTGDTIIVNKHEFTVERCMLEYTIGKPCDPGSAIHESIEKTPVYAE